MSYGTEISQRFAQFLEREPEAKAALKTFKRMARRAGARQTRFGFVLFAERLPSIDYEVQYDVGSQRFIVQGLCLNTHCPWSELADHVEQLQKSLQDE